MDGKKETVWKLSIVNRQSETSVEAGGYSRIRLRVEVLGVLDLLDQTRVGTPKYRTNGGTLRHFSNKNWICVWDINIIGGGGVLLTYVNGMWYQGC